MNELAEQQAQAAIMAMLAARVPGTNICPSEVARVLAGGGSGEQWRVQMPVVHAAVDRLLRGGLVYLSWKGEPKRVRSGPYRIARAATQG